MGTDFASVVFCQCQTLCKQSLHCLQDKPASLLGLATSAEDARVLLEALEAGTSGVVLKTEDPLQVYLHVPLRVSTSRQTLTLSALLI